MSALRLVATLRLLVDRLLQAAADRMVAVPDLRDLHRSPRGRLAAGVSAVPGRRDRGDVPGWVMVTLMTAGLVVALWAFAGGALQGLFQEAIDSVRTGG